MDEKDSHLTEIKKIIEAYKHDLIMINERSFFKLTTKDFFILDVIYEAFRKQVMVNSLKLNYDDVILNAQAMVPYSIENHRARCLIEVIINHVLAIINNFQQEIETKQVLTLKINKNKVEFDQAIFIDINQFYISESKYLPLKYLSLELTKIAENFSTVFLLLPDLKMPQLDFLGKTFITKEIIKIINEIPKKTVIIIPKENSQREIFLKALIQNVTVNSKTARNIVFEDEIYTLEEDVISDYAIVNFQIYAQQFKYQKNKLYQEFKNKMEEDYRVFHNISKEKRINDIIDISNVFDEQVIEKLIIMGFRSFIYSAKEEESLVNSINNYMKRRGKYSRKKDNKI